MINYFFLITNLAPGAYDVEKADKKVHGSAPAYSIKGKPKERKPEELPGIVFDLN